MPTGQLKGKNNPLWKGENVSYRVLHKWIVKNLGQPTKCEKCGKDDLTGRQIDWANKDHLYKRNLSDYMRLCRKCHNEYDIEHGLRNKKRNALGCFTL